LRIDPGRVLIVSSHSFIFSPFLYLVFVSVSLSTVPPPALFYQIVWESTTIYNPFYLFYFIYFLSFIFSLLANYVLSLFFISFYCKMYYQNFTVSIVYSLTTHLHPFFFVYEDRIGVGYFASPVFVPGWKICD